MKVHRTIAVVVSAGLGLVPLSFVACSGDDMKGDGGGDARPDNTLVDSPVTEGGGDSGDAGQQETGADAHPIDLLAEELAQSYCKGLSNCCPKGFDGGVFDMVKCLAIGRKSGWGGSLRELTPEVRYGGKLKVDQNLKNDCKAGLETVSCPQVTAVEYKGLTDKCFGVLSGTEGVGQPCLASVECQSTMYCDLTVDAGVTDAGTKRGLCAALKAQGALCGQSAPFGPPNYTSEECGYRGWIAPPRYCNYDSDPDKQQFKCAALRANNDVCFADNECASGMCGQCDMNGCKCVTFDNQTLGLLCDSFSVKDAGAD